ncbi:ABC transporter permease (plasmid) [Rhodococcus pyridinivorans]|jgi:peptide/nickel transport system permease protein|uniref:ABC transporter permease n=1 Tax=Rhodococcus TaxID=1827 RepID=UPI0007D9A6B1|nr:MULTISPECIES: ABC transporter permease [Rhodococcus]QQM53090.1 ABC transporter permease [Rhodococcus pyridinivorans]UTM40054.1 ABC transporter permease [Rhodococcus pyridinivorans]WAL49550.1 ABC transporter permease [Rhodococcus pyridinivorans]
MSDLTPTKGHAITTGQRVGVALLVIMIGYAVLTPWIAGPQAADFTASRTAPSTTHWFGTDHFGYDLFVRTAEGLRISLAIAALCAITSTLIGVSIGAAAATLGGRLDAVLMRGTDTVNALPHLLLGIVIVAMFPGSLPAIIASIALTHWPQVARLVRGQILAVRCAEYVEAAYLWGASRTHVMRQHLLPAAAGQALIAVLMLLPHAIWHESTLSFLGFGLSPDRPSIGTLLEQARGDLLTGAWWTLAAPAGALVVTTLAVAALTTSRRVATDTQEVAR